MKESISTILNCGLGVAEHKKLHSFILWNLAKRDFMNRPQSFSLVLTISWKPYPLSKLFSNAPINDQNFLNLFENYFFPSAALQ